MQVVTLGDPCPRPPAGAAATIGFFDGVHLGHRVVVETARRLAEEAGALSAVVTFDRHPASVVRPASAPPLLTDLGQRLERLAETGADLCLVVPFDEDRSREEADDFVSEVLVECLAVRAVVVGADFHFGHRRRGDVALLRRLGAELGFEVHGLDLAGPGAPTVAGGEPISSTAIRRALAAGDLVTANAMLGRAHEVRGVVERGDGRGASLLGYPTANVAVASDVALPAAGIYAGWYLRPDHLPLPAAISLGWRPTFAPAAERLLLEAHVLDFHGDLYGEEARVRFVARLRDELRFDAVDALVAQMGADVAAVRSLLDQAPTR